MTLPQSIRCLGCGGIVPDVAEPTHAYMLASPGCWQTYTELLARASSGGISHVDAYAAQHPGGADGDLRQRRSVAVHLTALCLGIEFGIDRLDALRSRLSATVLPRLRLAEWPLLPAPESRGGITVADVAARSDAELAAVVQEWSSAVWDAWRPQHDTVRLWARTAIGAA